MKILFSLANVRALGNHLGGKTERQVLREFEAGKFELTGRCLAGEPTGKRSQQVVLLGQLLAQRRQRGGDLRKLSFLRSDVKPGGVTLFKLGAKGLKHVRVDVHELAGGLNLPAQGSFLDGGGGDVRAEGD